MSVEDTIRQRIAADKAYDRSRIDEDTLEGARADIVGEILELAEHWQDKAVSWDFQESYCNFRAMVCQEVLELLAKELWDETERPSA